jgi:cryptochrome
MKSFAGLSVAVVLQVFEELLLDADWALNAGNWMWLSASAFFHQYFR